VWAKLIETPNKTNTKMITASAAFPRMTDTRLAISRMITSGLKNRRSNSVIAAPRLIGAGSFGPYCVTRVDASCEDSTVGAGDVTHGCARSVSEARVTEIHGTP